MQRVSNGLRGLLRRSLARFGYYLGRYPRADNLSQHLIYLFSCLGINCVLDVGAHTGDFGLELRRLGYSGRIESFEPVAETFATLAKCCAGDGQWHAHRFALGRQDGMAEIHVTGGSTFSSFLRPSPYGVEQFGEKLQGGHTEKVEVRRLEEVFDQLVAGVDRPRVFLKIDTQGHDREVIEGAGSALGRICALQTELSVKPIYQGMSTSFAESVAYLQGLGFELTGLFPVTWDRHDRLRVIELDCVMCRPPEKR
jgi:FkbM family methyltransferase